MTIVLYGLLAFAVIFGGGMLDLLLGKVIPEGYRGDATKSMVQTARRASGGDGLRDREPAR
jgi:hypothetical protein